MAGSKQATTPIRIAAINNVGTTQGWIVENVAASGVKILKLAAEISETTTLATIGARPKHRPIPSKPATIPMMVASIINMSEISIRRAPKLLSNPISRFLSFTEIYVRIAVKIIATRIVTREKINITDENVDAIEEKAAVTVSR